MTEKNTTIRPREFERLLRRQPFLADGFQITVEDLSPGFARIRLGFDDRFLRPGGTICGPVLFTLADATLYAMVLATAGKKIMAVTSDMNIRFLKKPLPGGLIAESRLIKGGRRSIYGEVLIYSEGQDEPVAHVTGAYALPAGG